MFFQQMYLGCLAQASYLIGSNGEAAVVDPRRDVDEYIAIAATNGLTIRYVIETHLHADFVSGHRELAARTGASIAIATEANAEFPHLPLADGDVLPLGALSLRIMATPGHTLESICIVIEDAGRPVKVLTGDTLFVGDVGRPDLASGAGISSEQMASMLYESLHRKLLLLPDDVEVWPAHGAGSLCGKNMSAETSSTIGIQRRANYALQPMPKHEFVSMLTRDMVEAPQYFARDVRINRSGAAALCDAPAPQPMSAAEVARAMEDEAIVLDVRRAEAFGEAHIPRALHIGLNGQYASWAGSLIPAHTNILLVTESGDDVEEAAMRLTRVGLENTRGYLRGGVGSWREAGLRLAAVPQLSVTDASELSARESRAQLIDVRRPGEYRDRHARGFMNMPLHQLTDHAGRMNPQHPTAVICAGGYRSSIGTSVLERLGFTNVYNVVGGTAAWIAAGLPAESAYR